MPKILSIDDERNFVKMILEYFKPRGYEVFVSSTSDIGVEIANRERPDVVLIDLKMPGMDGSIVFKRLKAIDPNMKIIMITAYQDNGYIKNKLMGDGLFAYFEKPISSLKTLELKIKEAVTP